MATIRCLCMVIGLTAASVTGSFAAEQRPGTMAARPQLQPGDLAPTFSLPGSDGKTYNLADFKGRQVVILAWFAKAFTGG